MAYENSDFIRDSIQLAVKIADELHPDNSELWVLTYNHIFIYASEGHCPYALLDSLRSKKTS